jgi:uncharacterized protein (TIGR02266 family)
MRTSNPDLPNALVASERRASPRKRLEVEVSLTSESNFFAGLAGDVSSGGIFVSTYELKAVGTKIELAFSMGEAVFEARGVVRWVQEGRDGVRSGLGISFEGLTPDDLKRIEAFCATRPPLYFDVDESSLEMRRPPGVKPTSSA